MSELTLATKHTVVSMLARGRRVQDVADRTALPISLVQSIGRENGAPDLGRLAHAAEEMRRHMDKVSEVRAVVEGKPVNGGVTATTGVGVLLAEAERIGHARLISRAKDVAARLDQLRTDLAAAVKVADGKAAKDAKLTRLAELRAEEAKIRAELRGDVKPTTKTTRKAAAPKVASEASVIRLWAKGAGVECPGYGKVPQYVRDAYTAAVV